MPYIEQERRQELVIFKDPFCEPPDNALTVGELNFQLTDVILNYMDTKGESYQTINDILGALEGAKLEFYRRVAAPYEEEKRKRNGDVY